MEHSIEKIYKYEMGWGLLLSATIISSGLGYFVARKALTNDVGLLINGIIELDTGGATIFFWCLAIFMFFLSFIGVMGIVEKIKGKNRIAITKDGVILPNVPWKKGEAYFSYDSVKKLTFNKLKKIDILDINTSCGKYRIASNRLAESEDFNDISQVISDRVKLIL